MQQRYDSVSILDLLGVKIDTDNSVGFLGMAIRAQYPQVAHPFRAMVSLVDNMVDVNDESFLAVLS